MGFNSGFKGLILRSRWLRFLRSFIFQELAFEDSPCLCVCRPAPVLFKNSLPTLFCFRIGV